MALTLLTGGARSGKSRMAQSLALPYGRVAYIATGVNTDAEMAARIEKHRQDRPAHFITCEQPIELHALLPTLVCDAAIIDCVGAWVTNELFARQQDFDALSAERADELEKDICTAAALLVDAAGKCSYDIFAVTNEVGMGLVPPTPLGRLYRDVLGRVNQMLAQAATRVVLMVSGLPFDIKGGNNKNCEAGTE